MNASETTSHSWRSKRNINKKIVATVEILVVSDIGYYNKIRNFLKTNEDAKIVGYIKQYSYHVINMVDNSFQICNFCFICLFF